MFFKPLIDLLIHFFISFIQMPKSELYNEGLFYFTVFKVDAVVRCIKIRIMHSLLHSNREVSLNISGGAGRLMETPLIRTLCLI